MDPPAPVPFPPGDAIAMSKKNGTSSFRSFSISSEKTIPPPMWTSNERRMYLFIVSRAPKAMSGKA
jgi:hypothetical protein